MKIAFDAKRAFWNNRGLGNYSRDVIRLLATYAPANEYFLCGVPRRDGGNICLRFGGVEGCFRSCRVWMSIMVCRGNCHGE